MFQLCSKRFPNHSYETCLPALNLFFALKLKIIYKNENISHSFDYVFTEFTKTT